MTRFKSCLVAVVTFSIFLITPADASLLVYEPFNYPAQAVLDGLPPNALNLTGPYVAIGTLPFQEVEAASPGLTYGSLLGAPVAVGNRLTQSDGITAGGAIVGVDQDVVVNPGNAVYFSALFTFDDSSNGNRLANITLTDLDNGDLIRFGEAGVGVRAIRIEADTVATGQQVANGADQAFTDGQTLFLIGRYTNSATANADVVELIGYDIADADILPAAFNPADPNAEFSYSIGSLNIDLAKISEITFTIRGDANNFIDELRIGSTYAAIVPEPGTIGILLIGLAGLAVASRFTFARRTSATHC
jgi:hypothetical protein